MFEYPWLNGRAGAAFAQWGVHPLLGWRGVRGTIQVVGSVPAPGAVGRAPATRSWLKFTHRLVRPKSPAFGARARRPTAGAAMLPENPGSGRDFSRGTGGAPVRAVAELPRA